MRAWLRQHREALGHALNLVPMVGHGVVRSRVMFMMGLRNIPRRMGQTVLIVIGLMLSTLIISAAFTTGDTVDHSLTSQSYELLGHVDVVIYRAGEDDAPRAVFPSIVGRPRHQARDFMRARAHACTHTHTSRAPTGRRGGGA